MTYTVTFYVFDPDAGEVVVTAHRIEKNVLAAYTRAPGVVLATARSVSGSPKADGYRVTAADGQVVLDVIT